MSSFVSICEERYLSVLSFQDRGWRGYNVIVQFYVISQYTIEKSNICRTLFITQMILRSHLHLNRTRISMANGELILLQIRHNALRVNRISIHHSPLRDHNNVLCKVHHPISRYRLLDLRLTTTLLSRSIPI